MALEAFMDEDVKSEIAIRDARVLDLETKVRDWQRWYDGVVADFVGLTTDPSDPSRTHDWEWLDEWRPAPMCIELPALDE